MTLEDIKNIIYFLIAVIGCAIGIYGFSRNRKSDLKAEERASSDIHESLLKLNLKTDQICATTNETRTDIKAMQQQVNALDKEVGIVKRDLQTAFMRIDELRENQQK